MVSSISMTVRSPASTSSADFNLGIPFVSTLPTFIDTFVEPGLRMTMDGTPFALAGRTKPFKDSLETTIEVRIAALDLTRYLSYVPVPLSFDVASALLDLNIDVSFVRPSSQAARLTARGRAALDKVSLREKGGAPAGRPAGVRGPGAPGRPHGQQLRSGTGHLGGIGRPRPPRRGWHPESAAPGSSAPRAHHRAAQSGQDAAGISRRPGECRGSPSVRSSSRISRCTCVTRRYVPPSPWRWTRSLPSIRHLSNAPGARATVTLGLHAAPGGTLKHEGSLTLTPLAGTGNSQPGRLEPRASLPTSATGSPSMSVQGRVRLGASYVVSGLGAPRSRRRAPLPFAAVRFPAGRGGPPDIQVEGGFLNMVGVALRRRGASGDFFRLKDFAVRGVKVNPALRTASIEDVVTHEGRVVAERDEKGVIDLTTLVGGGAGRPRDCRRRRRPARPAATPSPHGGPPRQPLDRRSGAPASRGMERALRGPHDAPESHADHRAHRL